jgi:glutamate-1-semialdehyde 2,1-aminomutase
MTTVEAGELATRLDASRRRFIDANPGSLQHYRRATESMPGGNTRSTLFYGPFPLTVTEGHGARILDADGHSYVDLLGEFTAGLYGHDHPVIKAAIEGVVARGWNYGGHGPHEADLAGLLCDRFPGIDLIRFTNSGTEANLFALATATAATNRSRIIVFDGGYHGGLFGFRGGGSPINVPHDVAVGRYNDADSAAALMAEAGEDLAAVLVEPMLGSGGCIPARPEWLAQLRASTEAAGAVLIFDEVMTSRMAGGGMQERLGIIPDLTSLGKYIGGGMSFGAFGGRRDLMAMYDPTRAGSVAHGGTWNNNVFSMAAGCAGLSTIFTPDVALELFERGEALRATLNAACTARRVAVQWTGLGSLMTIHFQATPIHSADEIVPAPELHQLFHLDLLDRGYYLANRGMIALSLAVGGDELDGFVAAFSEFLDDHCEVLAP